jgi:hypothetical protein
MRVAVTLNFVDLANPSIIFGGPHGPEQATVRIGTDRVTTYVTAGEAQVIAEAWNRIADEIVERERGAA